MFLQTSLTSYIVPTISKTVCDTTYILVKPALTCQKINQAFFIAVKAMADTIWHMGYCAGKDFCLRYIETNLVFETVP